MDNDRNNEYKTKDLGEVGVLLIKNQKLLRTQRDGKTVWFVFEHNKQCEELVRDFYFGELTVTARNYAETLKMLKAKVK